ncbi:hypothetical protein NCCP2222_23730 [Sporosarcina sp. NCCP-2222]|nr:hypothetical protein NCCP2222_23730 [Sporosarcina sp. NCCP-2222]
MANGTAFFIFMNFISFMYTFIGVVESIKKRLQVFEITSSFILYPKIRFPERIDLSLLSIVE